MKIRNILFLVSILHCRGESSESQRLRRGLGYFDPRTDATKPVKTFQQEVSDASEQLSIKSSQLLQTGSSSISSSPKQQPDPANSVSPLSAQQQSQTNQSTQQEASQDHTNSSIENQPSKRLEFIHITKTGGTAIETVARKEGIMWGACHYREVPNVGCNSPNWARPKKTRFDGVRKYVGELWHAPAHWLNPNNMTDSDTFVVIRDPYDRIISEYYCSSFGYKGDNPEDQNVFNTWLGEQLEVVKSAEKVAGHMLPQHYYVYDQNGDRIVTHILRYENIKNDFDALMGHYKLPMRMPDKTSRTVTYVATVKDSTQRMTKDNISPENLQKINQIYADDFGFFDYPKMEKPTITTHA